MMYPTVPSALQTIAAALETGVFEDATAFGRSRAQSAAAALRIAAREYDEALSLRHTERLMLEQLLADETGTEASDAGGSVESAPVRGVSEEDDVLVELRSRLVQRLDGMSSGPEVDAQRARIAHAFSAHALSRERCLLGGS